MRKIICILTLLTIYTSKGFAQSASGKAIILPKAAIEVVTSAVGGTYAMFTETGNIYFDGANGSALANAMCYGDKATLDMYTGNVDPKIEWESDYKKDHDKNPAWCCFKSESFVGGTLVSWTGKFMGGDDIGGNDNSEYYKAVLKWHTSIGGCGIYLSVSLNIKEDKACFAKAKAYLEEMIANVKKTDFTKL